jgi:hypothetical protein
MSAGDQNIRVPRSSDVYPIRQFHYPFGYSKLRQPDLVQDFRSTNQFGYLRRERRKIKMQCRARTKAWSKLRPPFFRANIISLTLLVGSRAACRLNSKKSYKPWPGDLLQPHPY